MLGNEKLVMLKNKTKPTSKPKITKGRNGQECPL